MKTKLYLVSVLALMFAGWIGLSFHPKFQSWYNAKIGSYHARLALECFNKINEVNIAFGSYWNEEKKIVNLDIQILDLHSVRLSYAQAAKCILINAPEAKQMSILDTYFAGFFDTLNNANGYELRIYAFMTFYDRPSAEAFADNYMDNDILDGLRANGSAEWTNVYQLEQFGFIPSQLPMQPQLDLRLVKVALRRAIKLGYIQ